MEEMDKRNLACLSFSVAPADFVYICKVLGAPGGAFCRQQVVDANDPHVHATNTHLLRLFFRGSEVVYTDKGK